ncbi:papilin [Drosophila gunungcola]|uniref:papilin n=1 Tax=Drosophila gunungcola TaxID=103775 RepID=UPI0022E49BB5|nr:papilin [Drosophila gunungcola]
MKAFMLIAVLVALLASATVNASCGRCADSHSCIGEREFQICFDGVRDQTVNYTCPDDTPICTDYSVICFANGTDVQRGCGDVSKCGQCAGFATFACTSLTTFAICNNGEVSANDIPCAEDYVCSASQAASGNPCITRCESTDDDICDRIVEAKDDSTTTASETPTTDSTLESSTESSSTDASMTTSDSSTGSSAESSTETPPSESSSVTEAISSTEGTATTPVFNEIVYCQGISSMGRYPIPNDTVCTSYIYCVYKSGNWAGILYNCPKEKPYFNADIFNCATVRPANSGCTNLS